MTAAREEESDMALTSRVLTPADRHERREGTPESLLMRIRGEYLEMPELKITLEQATRLWGLGGETCRGCSADLSMMGFWSGAAKARIARAM